MTIPQERMTNAASLFTLIRRIGGNVGYAMTVTIMERRTQFHHSHLVENISVSHGSFLNIYHMISGCLHQHGYGPIRDKLAVFSLLDRLVSRQAAMLSYNDLPWVFMLMFVFIVIFVLFLPHSRIDKSAGH